jgi:hypothetical protein
MAKIDLDALSIEELASLRDSAAEKLYERVAARQAELEAEMLRLSQHARPMKKPPAAPIAKARKRDEADVPKEQATKAEQTAKAA